VREKNTKISALNSIGPWIQLILLEGLAVAMDLETLGNPRVFLASSLKRS